MISYQFVADRIIDEPRIVFKDDMLWQYAVVLLVVFEYFALTLGVCFTHFHVHPFACGSLFRKAKL